MSLFASQSPQAIAARKRISAQQAQRATLLEEFFTDTGVDPVKSGDTHRERAFDVAYEQWLDRNGYGKLVRTMVPLEKRVRDFKRGNRGLAPLSALRMTESEIARYLGRPLTARLPETIGDPGPSRSLIGLRGSATTVSVARP